MLWSSFTCLHISASYACFEIGQIQSSLTNMHKTGKILKFFQLCLISQNQKCESRCQEKKPNKCAEKKKINEIISSNLIQIRMKNVPQESVWGTIEKTLRWYPIFIQLNYTYILFNWFV